MHLEAAWAAGQLEEGLVWCVERLEQGHRPDEVYRRYALEFALELGRADSLLSRFPDLVHSTNPEVRALFSQVCWQRGQVALALETAEQAYLQSPSFLTAYCLATTAALRSTQEAAHWLREALRHAEGAGQPQRAVQAAAAYALLQLALGAYAQAEVWAGWASRVAREVHLQHPGLWDTLAMASGYARILGGRLDAHPLSGTSQLNSRLIEGDLLLASGQPEAAFKRYAYLDDQLTPVRARRLPILARKVRALLELNRLEEARRLALEALTLSQDTGETFRDWGELAYLMPTSIGAPSEAVEPLTKLLHRLLKRPNAPRAATAAFYLARAYLALGMEGKARSTLTRAGWVIENLSEGGRRFLAGPSSMFREVFALILPTSRLRLHFLGGNLIFSGDGRLELSPRHQEILAALTLHPAGLNAEQLALWVWGEKGSPDVARAEVKRLRQRLPLESRPYRLSGVVWADFLALRERLTRNDLEGALALYGGPLLPGSDAPGVSEAREELSTLLKTAVLAYGSPQQIFELALQEQDPAFWNSALGRMPPNDPRRTILEAKLRGFLESA